MAIIGSGQPEREFRCEAGEVSDAADEQASRRERKSQNSIENLRMASVAVRA
jgi:hypothetical protein